MKKHKVFLFDMDGVLVNSEQQWHTEGGIAFMKQLYGEELWTKLHDTTGMSLDGEYDLAVSHGFTMDKETFLQKYDEAALQMYETTVITEGLEDFLTSLQEMDFRIGIVSSSRRAWIDAVLAKITYKDAFEYVLSLNEKGLPSKPHPQGYMQAMTELSADPATTFILEDSNSGIRAGKGSGAFAIAFTPLLVDGYQQIPADAMASSFAEVLDIVRQRV